MGGYGPLQAPVPLLTLCSLLQLSPPLMAPTLGRGLHSLNTRTGAATPIMIAPTLLLQRPGRGVTRAQLARPLRQGDMEGGLFLLLPASGRGGRRGLSCRLPCVGSEQLRWWSGLADPAAISLRHRGWSREYPPHPPASCASGGHADCQLATSLPLQQRGGSAWQTLAWIQSSGTGRG